MDKVSVQQRSWTMRQVKSRNTAPEKRFRSLLHRLGFRFRLHRKDLPGCPDLVLPKHRLVVFINGCFWHRHPNCPRATMPASNIAYWQKKFAGNVQRDAINRQKLAELGWRVFTIWECELKSLDEAQKRFLEFIRMCHSSST